MEDTATKPVVGPGPKKGDVERSKAKIKALRAGELPQMVDWFDPLLLVKVGIRTVLSKTIGDYADQRPMQAAHDDPENEDDLCLRHDYRKIIPHMTAAAAIDDFGADKNLTFDADGALWVDFIADLGDGYEATYAMAYMIAQSQLEVAAPSKKEPPLTLPGGEFMIFGGDLAYPDATIKEYNDRCVTPYNDAFQLKEDEIPQRKLFFIAGNHDWYDGLAAFTSVFCAARDRFAKGRGKKIGGWQCEQRRSYFALGLPYGWWIWGIDLALNVTIDDAQKDYFELMSSRTRPGEKIIIVLHAPLWQLKEDLSHLHTISELARNNGAEVVAVLAGDLHFYSRYHSQSDDLDLQLITSGGGGAFAHPTHQESLKRKIVWPLPDESDPLPHTGHDYVDEEIAVSAENDALAEPSQPAAFNALRKRQFDRSHVHKFHSPAHFYPTRMTSRFLALKNLWLPFRNRNLALFIGVVYMMFAWVFQITVADPADAIKRAQFVQVEKNCETSSVNTTDELMEACKSAGRLRVREHLNSVFEPSVPANTELSSADQELFNARWDEGFWSVTTFFAKMTYNYVRPNFSVKRIVHAMLINPLFFMMVFGLFLGLIMYVDSSSFLVKTGLGILHFGSHMFLLLLTNAAFHPLYQSLAFSDDVGLTGIVVGTSAYTVLMLMIGGLIGGAVFGIYSALTSFFAGMHMDAFSAIGLKDYKNFLRLRFDKDGGLTIYAIGLDKVPGHKGWRPINPKKDLDLYQDHNPLIIPKTALKPRLIDEIAGSPEGGRWKWG